MKSYLITLLLGCTLGALTAQTFEGVIRLRLSGETLDELDRRRKEKYRETYEKEVTPEKVDEAIALLEEQLLDTAAVRQGLEENPDYRRLLAVRLRSLRVLGRQLEMGADPLAPGHQDLQIQVKGDKALIQPEGPLGPLLGDILNRGSVKETYQVFHDSKSYLPAQSQPVGKAKRQYRVVPTVRYRTIKGYRCREHLVQRTHGKKAWGAIWVATGIKVDPKVWGTGSSRLALLANVEGLPMELEFTDPQTKAFLRMEVLEVEAKALPDSLFEVPVGYRDDTVL